MKKIIYYLSMFVLACASGMIGLILFWLVWPYKTIEFDHKELPVLNENKVVKTGWTLNYLVSYTKYTDRGATVSRWLSNGLIHNFPNVTASPKKEGEYSTKASLQIPHGMEQGKYRLYSEACYQMNPLREICTSYATEEFEIIK